jgi:hypothetical protein
MPGEDEVMIVMQKSPLLQKIIIIVMDRRVSQSSSDKPQWVKRLDISVVIPLLKFGIR